MILLYNIFIQLYSLVARVISLYNKKAKLWVNGRKNILQEIQEKLKGNDGKVIWVHCASLGEFEQGRPIIEKIKLQNPNYKILLTFFSPSGYEVQKNYAGADYIFYLPIDTATNAKAFYDIVNPTLVVFVKYEFWFHFVTEANKRSIPLLLVSGIFRESQPFFKWYGGLHKTMLQCFAHFFLQDEQSATFLKSIGIQDNVTIGGDTRFDRVIEITSAQKSFEAIEQFIGNSKVIVAGSTWTEDDEELDHYANTHPEIKFIIAPHEIDEDRLKECLRLYKHSVLYSKINSANADCNVVIIDNIGMLSQLYRYATICYVGGGFGGDGVHNVLEAAAYFKPVIFGPTYEKYIEAVGLIEDDGAFTVESALELEETLNDLLKDESFYKTTCSNAGNFVSSKAGATVKIIDYIYEKRLLTN
jgi:3-deoxy-D-manno-octulosonic-acid transferase